MLAEEVRKLRGKKMKQSDKFIVTLRRDLNPRLSRNRKILRNLIHGKRARRYYRDSHWPSLTLANDKNYVIGVQHGLFLAEKTEEYK